MTGADSVLEALRNPNLLVECMAKKLYNAVGKYIRRAHSSHNRSHPLKRHTWMKSGPEDY